MTVRWTGRARQDRRNLISYVENESLVAALELDDRISQATTRLIAFPESGRLGRAPGTRELIVPNTPYIAIYAVQGRNANILRLLHSAQRWPDV